MKDKELNEMTRELDSVRCQLDERNRELGEKTRDLNDKARELHVSGLVGCMVVTLYIRRGGFKQKFGKGVTQ